MSFQVTMEPDDADVIMEMYINTKMILDGVPEESKNTPLFNTTLPRFRELMLKVQAAEIMNDQV